MFKKNNTVEYLLNYSDEYFFIYKESFFEKNRIYVLTNIYFV